MHFDFDDWEPDVTDDRRKIDRSKKGRYKNYRMIPQGVSLYFYSFEGKPFVNPKQPTIDIDPYLRQHIAERVVER